MGAMSIEVLDPKNPYAIYNEAAIVVVMARVMIVDDQPTVLKVLAVLLENAGHEAAAFHSAEEAREHFEKDSEFDLLISDIQMGLESGLDLLTFARRLAPSMPVILITAHPSVETAREATQSGVFDYVTKPFKLDTFIDIITLALEHRRALIQDFVPDPDAETSFTFGQFISAAPEMVKLQEMIQRLAITDTCVSIIGEYGTGRHTIGRAIHEKSGYTKGQFVVVPCSELPEPVLECLIFGETTLSEGAIDGKTEALVDRANGGTVFLEDVDTLSVPFQDKLAGFLKDYRDGRGERKGRARFLASSASDLNEAVRVGRFSKELFKQVGVVTVDIPPLRSRREDILPIACNLLRDLADDRSLSPRFTPDARALMFDYHWPGNISELAYVMEQVQESAKGGVVSHEDLPAFMVEASDGSFEHRQRVSMFQGRELRKYLATQIKTR